MTERALRKKYKPVCGKGINDADYPTSRKKNGKTIWECPYYRVWRYMLERVFSSNYHRKNPAYIGCTVCEEWLYFSNFKSWMEQQPNHLTPGYQLDKDIAYPNNRHYAPGRCHFVPHAINTLMTDAKSSGGKYPVGVSLHAKNNNFRAYISRYGSNDYLGSYDTPQEASIVRNEARHLYILEVVGKYPDLPEPVKTGLIYQAMIL